VYRSRLKHTNQPFMEMTRTRASHLSKRMVDIVFGVIALQFLIGPMMAIAGLIGLKLGRPIMFRQLRPGQNGRIFLLAKFRTMKEGRNNEGKPLADDLRLTGFGRILRKWSLDELPELWNVIKGDMSLVGPRPLLIEYLDRYTPEQARRHEVKPGITGWAQVNGRNAITWDDKFRLDVWYVDNRSLMLDLKIIALTISKILTKEGIDQPGHATMEEFLGGRE
jgi:sugar transferase EpsL